MTKVKWTSKGGMGIEEVKKHIPQNTSWLARLLQLIKGVIK